jgi:soluble lytic murein transglycosylase-like protein
VTATVSRLLAKSQHFASILLVLLAFPATALAIPGSGESGPQVAVGPAIPAAASALQRPVVRFQRVVHTVAVQIRAGERERERRAAEAAARHRRELFAELPGGVTMATLESIAACESGGDPTAVSSDGPYRGLYQFDYGTWGSVGGEGDPAAASAAEQSYRAALLYSRSGSSPWPVCG